MKAWKAVVCLRTLVGQRLAIISLPPQSHPIHRPNTSFESEKIGLGLLMTMEGFFLLLSKLILLSFPGNVIKSTMRPARQFTCPTVHMKSNCITSVSHPMTVMMMMHAKSNYISPLNDDGGVDDGFVVK